MERLAEPGIKLGREGVTLTKAAEYFHDWDHGLYPIARRRGGDDWLRYAGKPPMYYPTHSIGFVVSPGLNVSVVRAMAV